MSLPMPESGTNTGARSRITAKQQVAFLRPYMESVTGVSVYKRLKPVLWDGLIQACSSWASFKTMLASRQELDYIWDSCLRQSIYSVVPQKSSWLSFSASSAESLEQIVLFTLKASSFFLLAAESAFSKFSLLNGLMHPHPLWFSAMAQPALFAQLFADVPERQCGRQRLPRMMALCNNEGTQRFAVCRRVQYGFKFWLTPMVLLVAILGTSNNHAKTRKWRLYYAYITSIIITVEKIVRNSTLSSSGNKHLSLGFSPFLASFPSFFCQITTYLDFSGDKVDMHPICQISSSRVLSHLNDVFNVAEIEWHAKVARTSFCIEDPITRDKHLWPQELPPDYVIHSTYTTHVFESVAV